MEGGQEQEGRLVVFVAFQWCVANGILYSNLHHGSNVDVVRLVHVIRGSTFVYGHFQVQHIVHVHVLRIFHVHFHVFVVFVVVNVLVR